MKSPPSKRKAKATQSSEALSEDEYISHTGITFRADVNEDNYLDFTVKDVTCAVASVKFDFDEVAAQNMVRYFHYRLKNGCLFDGVRLKPKERAFVDYVEHAFARMVEQKKSPEVAFGFVPGRGEHKRENTTERDVIAAAYMVLLMKNSWRRVDAIGIVANFLFPDGNGESAVKEAYAKYRGYFVTLPEKTLLDFLPADTLPIKQYNA